MRFRLCISLFVVTLGSLFPGSAHSMAASEVDAALPSLFSIGAGMGSNAGSYEALEMDLSPRSALTNEPPPQGAGDAAWQHGPAIVRLDDTASIALPAGYRYLPQDLAMQLHRQENAAVTTVGAIDAPFSLIGPDDGSWMAQIIVMRKGHVPTSELNSGGAAFDLGNLRLALQEGERRKAPPYIVSYVEWIDYPSWDESHHRAEWAYRVFQTVDRVGLEATSGGAAAGAVTGEQPRTYTNSLTLGRRNVVWLRTAGIDEKKARSTPIIIEQVLRARFSRQFQDLAEGIRFDSGESYTDRRDGDEIAEFGLSEIISGEALRPKPSLLDRAGWLASPKMISGYALLFMVLMRLPWSRAKKFR